MSDILYQIDDANRVAAYVDESAEWPYDDGSFPIVRAEYSRWYAHRLERIEEVTDGTSYRLPADIVPALRYYARDHDRDRAEYLWGRYLRLWHDATGGVEVMQRDRVDGDPVLYAIAPRHWREAMGLTDKYLAEHPDVDVSPSFGDLPAYFDGDVWVVVHERKVVWTSDRGETRDEWDTFDSVGGIYGSEYVEEAAREYFGGESE
jgi:hypothetical protein